MHYQISTIIAQISDSEVIRTMKEPGFIQWVIYAFIALLFADRAYQFITRHKAGRMEITGSVEASEKKMYADAKEVDRVHKELDNLREENASQHKATILAGEKRVTDLSKVMDQETAAVTERIAKMEDVLMARMEKGFEKLTEKLEKAAVKLGEHGSTIVAIDKRINELSERHASAVSRLHSRIDDTMQAATQALHAAADGRSKK